MIIMLFKQKHLSGIKDGTISLAFRKWNRPRVKEGSIIKTAIGQIEIYNISKISISDITKAEANNAGYSDLDELLLNLKKRSGTLFRLSLGYHSPDPRLALRNNIDISSNDREKILKKLERMDKASKKGPWTLKVLHAIADNPELRARDLAEMIGFEKDWLKPNVRKLKNMGLTISHPLGYSISPRGRVMLDILKNQ